MATAKKTKKKSAAAKKKPAARKPVARKPVARKPVTRMADERRFWDLLEAAWEVASPRANAQRIALATRSLDEDDETDCEQVDKALDKVIAALGKSFQAMTAKELVAIDGVIERKLYDIDRSEIQEVTDGSDDGFLYARGFILALGENFYDAVDANPKVAIMDAECEEICYLACHIHEKRFGKWPKRSSISRESCSNQAGWADAD